MLEQTVQERPLLFLVSPLIATLAVFVFTT